MSTFQKLCCRTWLVSSGLIAPFTSFAAFGGPIPDGGGLEDTPSAVDKEGIRNVILNALAFVLDFLALAAVVFIVIAGIRLIISQGGDEQKDKAKKTILYVIIGLLVILFARVIVGFFTTTVSDCVRDGSC